MHADRRPSSWLIVLALVWSMSCSRAEGPANEAPQKTAPVTTSRASPPASTRERGGSFVPVRDVDALDQPQSHHTVAHLKAGTSYRLEKRGGPGEAWCKVEADGVQAWVLCKEGEPGATPSPSSEPGANPSGGFDYYVLTLSWSPAFCETSAGARSPEQCGAGRHYAFVVHGLWPQNETGWPEHCAAGEGPKDALVKQMLDIMPSEHLVHHEWETHGTCSGMPAPTYFERLRAAFQSIHIPEPYVAPKETFTTDKDEIVAAFTKANPGIAAEDLAVECKHQLDEVRFCLDKELRPRRCSSEVRSACKGKVTVPPMR